MCDYDTEEARRRWNKHAAELTSRWTAEGDLSRQVLLNPVLLPLIGEATGSRVLDAGCGEGYLSRMLAERGAEVLGVDYSEEMLRIARERTPDAPSVRYVHGSCERMGFLPDRSFDLVVSNLVLQDFRDYEVALGEFHRVLRPGGRLVLAITHPCFTTPECGWVRDEEGNKLHWKVDRYFDETPFAQEWPSDDEGIIEFHRTLSSYYNAVVGAGFRVDRLVEPKPSEQVLERSPEWRHDLRMCHFLVFDCRRPERG